LDQVARSTKSLQSGTKENLPIRKETRKTRKHHHHHHHHHRHLIITIIINFMQKVQVLLLYWVIQKFVSYLIIVFYHYFKLQFSI